MRVSLLVTTHQRKWIRNVRENLARQRVPVGVEMDVCVVVNGAARKGDFLDLGVALEQSRDDVSDARNVALGHAREVRSEYMVWMDQDDWYGPDYLTEAFEHRDRATVVGKSTCYYELSDGQVVLLDTGLEDAPCDAVRGPTLAGWTAQVPDFQPCNQWGEDEAWQDAIRAAGGTFYATSRRNFVGQRADWREHTWCITDLDFAMMTPRIELLASVEAALAGERGKPVEDILNQFDGIW